jgi:hypothetical protein
MKTPHTPGPWYVGSQNDALFIINKPPSPAGTDLPPDTPHPGLVVIGRPHFDVRQEFSEYQANANLIAAAPELLDAASSLLRALEGRLQDCDDDFLQAVTAIRQAVGKAKGK